MKLNVLPRPMSSAVNHLLLNLNRISQLQDVNKVDINLRAVWYLKCHSGALVSLARASTPAHAFDVLKVLLKFHLA